LRTKDGGRVDELQMFILKGGWAIKIKSKYSHSYIIDVEGQRTRATLCARPEYDALGSDLKSESFKPLINPQFQPDQLGSCEAVA